jgi:L-histidine N-alpha-methyltransferase
MHHAAYNVRLGCMESWLVSRRRQRVPIESLHHSIMLEAWEGIRVERSYKYDLDQIEAFAAATGWEVRGHFFDSRRYFVDSLWAAAG